MNDPQHQTSPKSIRPAAAALVYSTCGLTGMTKLIGAFRDSCKRVYKYPPLLCLFKAVLSATQVLWTLNAGLCLSVYGAASLGVLVHTFRFIYRAKQPYGKAWRAIWVRVMTAFFRCHHPQVNNKTSLLHSNCSWNVWLWRLKAHRSSETSNTTQLKQLHIPEELSPKQRRYQNLKCSSACLTLGYCPRIYLEKLSQDINEDHMTFGFILETRISVVWSTSAPVFRQQSAEQIWKFYFCRIK